MAKPTPDIPEEAFTAGSEDVVLEDQGTTDAPAAKVRMKYKGLPPYGTEFLTAHSLSKDDVRAALTRTGMDEEDVKEAVRGFKETVWHKDRGWVADVSDMPPAMLDVLDADPAWSRVD